MTRRSSRPRALGKLQALRENVAALQRARYPAILVVDVYADDDGPAALRWIEDVEALFSRVAPETVIAVIQPDARRPAELLPPWTPGRRAFLDWHPGRDEWPPRAAVAPPAAPA